MSSQKTQSPGCLPLKPVVFLWMIAGYAIIFAVSDVLFNHIWNQSDWGYMFALGICIIGILVSRIKPKDLKNK
jgi:hypothetical protein